MAKYPYLSLEAGSVDFGCVLVGRCAEAAVRFGNHSPVPAHFTLERVSGCGDGTLGILPMR